jgi:hypothetical protein
VQRFGAADVREVEVQPQPAVVPVLDQVNLKLIPASTAMRKFASSSPTT